MDCRRSHQHRHCVIPFSNTTIPANHSPASLTKGNRRGRPTIPTTYHDFLSRLLLRKYVHTPPPLTVWVLERVAGSTRRYHSSYCPLPSSNHRSQPSQRSQPEEENNNHKKKKKKRGKGQTSLNDGDRVLHRRSGRRLPPRRFYGSTLTIQEGANTQVYLAAAKQVAKRGAFYDEKGTVGILQGFARDETKAKELWKPCHFI